MHFEWSRAIMQGRKGVMILVDIERLKKAIQKFDFDTHISRGDSSSPCTVGEYRQLVESIERLFCDFLDELKK